MRNGSKEYRKLNVVEGFASMVFRSADGSKDDKYELSQSGRATKD
jgi:hypothetical protein